MLITLFFKMPLEYNKFMYRNMKYINRTNKKNKKTLLKITDGRNNIKINIFRWIFSS
jgi:hypothetical protein